MILEHICTDSCYALRCADKNNFARTIHAFELCCSPSFYISKITSVNNHRKPFCRWIIEYKSKNPSHRYRELARESFNQILLHKPKYVHNANKGMMYAPFAYSVEYTVKCDCYKPIYDYCFYMTSVSRDSVSSQFIEDYGIAEREPTLADISTIPNEDISNIKMEQPVAGVSAEVSEDFINIKVEPSVVADTPQ